MMSPLTFLDALERAEVCARQGLPHALHGRLSCAVSLVTSGAVSQQDDGTWRVASGSKPDHTYHLNGHGCQCEDATYRAPQGYCKHVLAVLLARKAAQLLATPAAVPAETPAPTPAPLPEPPKLPEAPASVNLRAMLYGFEVQITLRDGDERTLIDRLAALVKTPGLKPVPKPVPRTQWRKGGTR